MGFYISADDNRIAVLSRSLVTICDIDLPENRLSFNPRPKGRSVQFGNAAFQTCNDLVICTQLEDDDMSGSLQVWKVKDHSECVFSLDINIDKSSFTHLAPDGLTVIIEYPVSYYSWNHDAAQFYPLHFADEMRPYGIAAYSHDGELFACSSRMNNTRVWDIRTGQLYLLECRASH